MIDLLMYDDIISEIRRMIDMIRYIFYIIDNY